MIISTHKGSTGIFRRRACSIPHIRFCSGYDRKLSGTEDRKRVVKPFEVEASTIAPAFGKIGLGTQYRFVVSADVLLKRGIISVLGGS